MSWYKRVVYPVLGRMDAEGIHERTLSWLEMAQRVAPGRATLKRIAGQIPNNPVKVCGLTFPNVLGVAAGFDKDARVPAGLALLGFGHIELGTLTPWQQIGNPRPRVFRLPSDQAIINRMGFPNGGMVSAVPRLRKLTGKPRDYVIGVSLGKQKETPLVDAANDYISVMRAVFQFADYLAVNISSPNTPGLRELQGEAYLDQLLAELKAENRNLAALKKISPRPLLVKIAPDLSWAELDTMLAVSQKNGIDGIIATNTTITRPDTLTHANQREKGGLSGAPLTERSTEIIAYIHKHAPEMPIIGVGGVRSAEDVQAKLSAGAKLVQVYTGFVYEGPGFPGRVLRQLAQ